jgi:hypothetical protein
MNEKNINPIVIDTNAPSSAQAQPKIQIVKYEPVANAAEQSLGQEVQGNNGKQVKRRASKVKLSPPLGDKINEQALLNQNVMNQQVQYVQAISNEPSHKKTRMDLINDYISKNNEHISSLNTEPVQVQQANLNSHQNEYVQVVNTQQHVENNAFLENNNNNSQQQTYFIQTNANSSNICGDVNNMNVANNEQFKNILNNLKANLNLSANDSHKVSAAPETVNAIISNNQNSVIKQNTNQAEYDMNCYPVDSSSLFNINLNDIEWIA